MTLRIDILMCTFRRPMVAEATRRSGASPSLPGAELRLVIADNDDTDSAREVVARAAQTLPFPATTSTRRRAISRWRAMPALMRGPRAGRIGSSVWTTMKPSCPTGWSS